MADSTVNSLANLVQQDIKTAEDLLSLKQQKTKELIHLEEQKGIAKIALDNYNLARQTLDRLQLQTSDAAATLWMKECEGL